MMRREELIPLYNSILEDMVRQPIAKADAREYSIRTTSGTSGQGPLVVISRHGKQVYRADSEHAEALLLANGARGIRMANLLYAWNIEYGPRRILTCGGLHDLGEGLADVVDDFQPDMIKGTLSTIFRVMENTALETRKRVSVLRGAGELYMTSHEAHISEHFPNATMALTYLSAEMGVMGVARCGYVQRNHYHPEEGVTITIDEAEDGVGEIYVSKTLYAQRVVTDYHTGDMGRWAKGVCPCGAAHTFEVLGRKGHDYVKAAGMVIRRDEVEHALSSVRHCFDTYQARVSVVRTRNVYQGHLEIVFFRKAGPLSSFEIRTIADIISREMRVTPQKQYHDLVAQKLCLPMTITYSEEPLAVSNKTSPVIYLGERVQ